MLLDKLNWDPSKDKIISCGDLVEKGPASDKVIDFFMKEESASSVKGNHDESLVRYWKHEGKVSRGEQKKNPMKAHKDRVETYEMLSEEHFKYIDDLPWWLEFSCGGRDFMAIHGGLFPGKHPSEMDTSVLCRARYIKEKWKEKRKKYYWTIIQPGAESKKDKFWAHYYKGEFGHIFYGHQPYYGKWKEWDFATGIDGGCVYGGSLIAAIVDEDRGPLVRFEKIDAKKAYAEKYMGPVSWTYVPEENK